METETPLEPDEEPADADTSPEPDNDVVPEPLENPEAETAAGTEP
jgi:hypothetical protein